MSVTVVSNFIQAKAEQTRPREKQSGSVNYQEPTGKTADNFDKLEELLTDRISLEDWQTTIMEAAEKNPKSHGSRSRHWTL